MPSLAFFTLPNAALALIVWTLVVMVILYAYRLPAMAAAKVSLEKIAVKGTPEYAKEIATKISPEVTQKAENYNHLMEQPTIFYALVFYIASHAKPQYRNDALLVFLAWAYVALRVAHSLVQCFYNRVGLRFLLFASASVCLTSMAVSVLVEELRQS